MSLRSLGQGRCSVVSSRRCDLLRQIRFGINQNFLTIRRIDPMSGLFISDLHLFSRRSMGQRCWNDVSNQIDETQLLVLGGDSFDFRWSLHRTLAQTLPMAVTWLQAVLDDFQGLQVAHILGNHDCHAGLQEVMSKLASKESWFSWSEYQLQVGSRLFVHGLVANGQTFHNPGASNKYCRFAGMPFELTFTCLRTTTKPSTLQNW